MPTVECVPKEENIKIMLRLSVSCASMHNVRMKNHPILKWNFHNYCEYIYIYIYIFKAIVNKITDNGNDVLINAAQVVSSNYLRTSPPEDQAGVLHAISPIWIKLGQIDGTTQQL